MVGQSYIVELPSGSQTTQLKTIRITPATGTISLVLPSANVATTGLILTATGDGMTIDSGGIFINASASGSGNPFQLGGKLRINNGGKYVHRTPRGNAELIDKLNNESGTEKGIFEFDVPGSAGYTVSLTGNIFGSLSFRSETAGGIKSYSGSGTSNLLIRGDLLIGEGVQLTSTLTSDITLYGSLVLKGKLNLHPVTTGTIGRSFVFSGREVSFEGAGTMSMNAFFRSMVVSRNSSLRLETSFVLNYTPNTFICQGSLHCKDNNISGAGSFILSDSAHLISGSDSGIWLTANQGNIKTAFRSLSTKAHYSFAAGSSQLTGDGIPDTIASLMVNNPTDLTLSKTIVITDSLVLQQGIVITDSTKPVTLSGAVIRSPANLMGDRNIGWEQSFVRGPVVIRTFDTGWHVIPSGSGYEYRPIKLKPTVPSSHEVMVQHLVGPHPVTELQPSLNRITNRGYFIVKSAFPGSWQMAMNYNASDSTVSDSEIMTIGVLRDNSGALAWGGSLSSRSTAADYGWLQSDTALSGFISLAIGYTVNSLLPIELIEFSADNQGRYNLVSWKSEQEKGLTQYFLERSPDGRLYTVLYSTSSNAQGVSTYNWKDLAPLEPQGYYRLRMVSGPRRTIYSKAIRVNYHRRKALLFPNPAKEFIQINFPDRSSTTVLEIVNSHGIVLSNHFVKKDFCLIRVSDLKPGFYFARLRDSEGTVILPFTKY